MHRRLLLIGLLAILALLGSCGAASFFKMNAKPEAETATPQGP
jgi:hypothetical protein